MLQRDIFILEIIKKMDNDRSIYFLSADFGAQSLDILRERFPDRFIHCGISEQAMIDIGTGLALSGNKVFCYAMAPFISLRCIEQTKCGPGLMNLPICLISVGIGLGYADAGPTHYANEDLACLSSLVGINIYTPSDNVTVKKIALNYFQNPKFSYIRLDRNITPDLSPKILSSDFNQGFKVYGKINKKNITVISHGKIFHRCLEIMNSKQGNNIACVNIIKSKPFPETLHRILSKSKAILVVDEQTPSGNLGAQVFENMSTNNIFTKIKVCCIDNKYIFENGGRDYLLDKFGLSKKNILSSINKLLKQ